ncbi:MAG: hypothetical protein JWR61_1900 [Ferruginibacter sp.]|nr:hypothetical protein [Ferruginibacter sp.]
MSLKILRLLSKNIPPVSIEGFDAEKKKNDLAFNARQI